MSEINKHNLGSKNPRNVCHLLKSAVTTQFRVVSIQVNREEVNHMTKKRFWLLIERGGDMATLFLGLVELCQLLASWLS